MIRRTFQGAIQVIGGFGAGFAILAMVLVWRLSSGPVSLAFLTPYIESALNSVHPAFRFRLGETILTWAGWDRTLDVRVLNVQIHAGDEADIATIPEVSLSLSARALARGRIAPASIELFGPRLFFVRRQDGTFEIALGEQTDRSQHLAGRLVRQLLASPDETRAMGYLARLDIISGDLTIIDHHLGRSWRAPAADVRLRRDDQGIAGSAAFYIAVADEPESRIEMRGVYRTTTGKTEVGIDFGRAIPATFAPLAPAFAPLSAFDLPVGGAVTVTLGRDGSIGELSFDLGGEQGKITLPDPVRQTIGVQKVSAKGHYLADAGGRVEIERLAIDLGADGAVLVPAEPPHRMPFRRLEMRGQYQAATGVLDVAEISADLAGPTVTVSGRISNLGAAPEAQIEGRLRGVTGNELRRYWPQSWGRDAYDWCVAHISEGVVPEARVRAILRTGAGGRISLVELDGSMELHDLTIDYLPPLPKARHASGKATFNASRFDIAIEKGETGGLTTGGGSVRFTGLDKEDQDLEVDLALSGSFRDAMTLVERPPLGFASALSIDPSAVTGEATARLKLQIPLLKTLTFAQVKVKAEAQLKDVSVPSAVLGLGLKRGTLALRLDEKGMDVAGRGAIGTFPADISWRQNFGEKAQFRARYQIKGKTGELASLSDLGVEAAFLPDGALSGTLAADVTFIEQFSGKRRIEAKAALDDLQIELKPLGWQKSRGARGTAEAVVELDGAIMTAIPRIAIEADGLSAAARATYARDGTGLERIDVPRLVAGKTDVSAIAQQRADGGWDLAFNGASFDFSPLWDKLVRGGTGSPEQDIGARHKLGVSATLGRVWLGPGRSLDGVTGVFRHDGDRWRNMQAQGTVGAAKAFALDVTPTPDGNRTLRLTAADAGAFLRALDFYQDVSGGVLAIDGHYRDLEPGKPLDARAVIRDYRVREAPFLARLLSVAALTGILDELRGDGLSFSAFEMPFVLHEGVLRIHDARAFGTALGFTASGRVYTEADVMDVEGTVVPAYAINSALGHLPLVGDLFTGGQKGGGLFAATYKMTGPREDPKVTVNPLTALAPGFLRNLFGVFSPGGKDNADAHDPGAPSNQPRTR